MEGAHPEGVKGRDRPWRGQMSQGGRPEQGAAAHSGEEQARPPPGHNDLVFFFSLNFVVLGIN